MQEIFNNGDPISYLNFSLALAIVPFFLFSASCYIKISVVLSLLRNAIGVSSIPSAPIVAVVSILLSIHIMLPTMTDVFSSMEKHKSSPINQSYEGLSSSLLEGLKPLENFLHRHSNEEELKFFLKENQGGVARLSGLLLSFTLSELQAGFLIGFALFLPFLVLDLVVSHALIGLGMMMLSPTVISLPFKILLFVISDGWFLLCRSLVLSYQ